MGILRLMSNNIWKNDCNCPAWEAKGEDCSAVHRAKGLARMYIETDPDIIGLQECSAVMLEELMEHFAAAELPFAVLWGRDTPILYRSDKFELLDSEFALYPEEIPGLEEDVITRLPVAATPITMLIAAISLSACKNTPPSILGSLLDI